MEVTEEKVSKHQHKVTNQGKNSKSFIIDVVNTKATSPWMT